MSNELVSKHQIASGKLGYSLTETWEGPDVGDVGSRRNIVKGSFASSAAVLGVGTPAALIHSDTMIGSLAWLDAGSFWTLFSVMIAFSIALFVGGWCTMNLLVASREPYAEEFVDEIGEDVERYSGQLTLRGMSRWRDSSREVVSVGKNRIIITDYNSNDNKNALRITDKVDRFNLLVSRKIEQFTKDTVLWDDAVDGIMQTVKIEQPLTREQESRIAAYKAGYSYTGIPGIFNRMMDRVAPIDTRTREVHPPPRWLKRKN